MPNFQLVGLVFSSTQSVQNIPATLVESNQNVVNKSRIFDIGGEGGNPNCISVLKTNFIFSPKSAS